MPPRRPKEKLTAHIFHSIEEAVEAVGSYRNFGYELTVNGQSQGIKRAISACDMRAPVSQLDFGQNPDDTVTIWLPVRAPLTL